MEKEHIIITDSSNGMVYITEYDLELYDSYIDFYDELNDRYDLGLKESQCDCMIVTGEMNIKIL